jgi:O-antigen/teichoic acid export membrane protein
LNGTATVAYGTVDRVIVGRFLGTAAAAQFHIYIQLTQLIHYIPANVFAFAFPVFSRLSAGGAAQVPALKRMYRRLLAAIAVCAVVAGAALIVLRHPVLSLFTGRGLGPINEPALLLLIGGFAVLALNIAPYYLLLGLGESKAVSLINSLSVAAAVALAWVLVPRLGIQGAALARFGYVLGTLTLLVRAHKSLRMSEVT